MTTFGVLQFPGSCDDRDALLACQRVGDTRLVWHEEPDLDGVDVAIVPGGFSYGDYLRAGAIALSDRLRPLLAGVERADSVTVDAHKWLSVPMGAGMVLTRHPDALAQTFRLTTAFMPRWSVPS